MPVPRIRLVVLNYNGGDLVVRCVEHLERLDWPADRLEIVVVDNASSDGSDVVLAEHPRVRLVRSPREPGVSRQQPRPARSGRCRLRRAGQQRRLRDARLPRLRSWTRWPPTPGVGAACPKIVFAPRFVDLIVHSPTHHATGDDRDLGIRISGVRVDGTERWRHTLFGDGVFHPERGPTAEPEFRWTAGTALVRVPVARHPAGGVEVRVASDRELVAKFDGGPRCGRWRWGGLPDGSKCRWGGNPTTSSTTWGPT